MIYILASDLHVRSSNPRYRIDKYLDSTLNKIDWIVELSNKYGYPIIISGDIFHSIRVGTRTVNRLTAILKKCKNKIYAIVGQHDLEFHSEDLEPTPYLTLMNSEVLINLGKDPIDNIYGIGWSMDILDNPETDDHSILVAHYCVTPKDPAFFLEENAMSAEDMLNTFPEFNFIVTGDYHTPHVSKIGDRILVNPGCISRANKDLVDFKPRVYILDTEKISVQIAKIPIKPASEVFKIPENSAELDEEFSKHIENIIKSSSNEDEKPKFINTVRMIMKDDSFTKRQRDIAEFFYSKSRNV